MSSNVNNFHELRPRIIVMGVGGAGGNAVNNMIASGLHGVEFVAANTDAQALSTSGADIRLQLGVNLTEGLGAGSNPEIGEGAAEEVLEEMKELLSDAHMVFIACGMGGGTGTGAAPVIARIAQEMGVLTVAVVTKPFQFEGQRRMRIAEAGIEQLRKYVDTMIVIPNQNLFRLANEQTTFADSFCLADSVLNSGVACVTDLIMKEGLINLDFADVKTVITEMGAAVMGTGVAHGEGRARKAAEEAISNPLIDDISLAGAKGLLISISGGQDMTLFEVDEVASRIRQEVDQNANIIVGATFDDQLEGYIRVSLVASGLNRGHPSSMHVEADRRRMEIDSEIEQNTLGLNERLKTLDTGPDGLAGGVQGQNAVPHSDPLQQPHPGGRMRPQPPGGQPGGEPGVNRDPRLSEQPAEQLSQHSSQQGRGNVKIVNKPPRFMAPGSERGYQQPQPAASNDRMTGREFVAGAPLSVDRSMRRMPSMEDLPITGQNQLRAYRSPDGQGQGYGAEPKKKGGFFSRLTGRNRKANEEVEEGEHEPASHQENYSAYDAPGADLEVGAARGVDGGGPESSLNNSSLQNTAEHSSISEGQASYSRSPQDYSSQYTPRSDGYETTDPIAHKRSVSSGEEVAVTREAAVNNAQNKPLDKAQGEYDRGMQEHYKKHPPLNGDKPASETHGVEEASDRQPLAHDNWVPKRPETPQERYPTVEMNKSGARVPLDEEEAISDIPPFLKEKREG